MRKLNNIFPIHSNNFYEVLSSSQKWLEDFSQVLDEIEEINLKKETNKNPAGMNQTYQIKNTEKEYIIVMLLPGIGVEDVSVEIEGNKIKVKSKEQETKMGEIGEVRQAVLDLVPRIKRGVSQVFEVPPHLVDLSKVEANFKDGVLTLKVPFVEKEIRKVDIV